MLTYKKSRKIKQGHQERRVKKANSNLMNIRSLLVQRRWYDLFLDPLCSKPPHLNLGSGGSGLEDSFPSQF
jgi:hypothetical protein